MENVCKLTKQTKENPIRKRAHIFKVSWNCMSKTVGYFHKFRIEFLQTHACAHPEKFKQMKKINELNCTIV